MEQLLGLLLVPVLVSLVFKYLYKKSFTWKEFAVLELAMIIVVTGLFFLARWGALQDTEHLNGRIASKPHGTMGCCHCRTVCDSHDKDGKCTSSHEECSHIHDYYWSLVISLGGKETETVSVRDCEAWESHVPVEWEKAYIGEPAVVDHGYSNWLLADKNSLYRKGAKEEYLKLIPSFPESFGYYKVRRVLSIAGATVTRADEWQNQLAELNAELGHDKQVDITMVVTRINDPTFADAVETKWVYGPKNGVIIVIGSSDGDTIDWARVVTISRVEEMKITLRDGLVGRKLSDVNTTIGFIRKTVVELFHRTHMTEFEYMAAAATPSTTWLVILYILGFLGSIGGSLFMVKNDVFGDERLSEETDLVGGGGDSGSGFSRGGPWRRRGY
jgi:hypothetical protein